MWNYLASNPLLAVMTGVALLFFVGLAYSRLENYRLEKTINYQHEIIKHQELTIAALEEDVKNAKLKQKHDEVARALSDDALRERMQHEGYYRG